MYQRADANRGRPPWRIHYADETIMITSWYVEVARTRIAVSELQGVVRCLTYQYPIIKVAVFTGGLEVLISIPLAAVYGTAVIVGVGAVSALGMMMAVYGDYRRNPRVMAIEGTVRGLPIVLFRSRDKRKFGQVWRGLVRAIEDYRWFVP